jgi:hypothetical protein
MPLDVPMVNPVMWLEALNKDTFLVLPVTLKSFTNGEIMKEFAQKPLLIFDTHLAYWGQSRMGLSEGSCDRSKVLNYDLVADNYSCKIVFLMHESNRSTRQDKPHACTDGDIEMSYACLNTIFYFSQCYYCRYSHCCHCLRLHSTTLHWACFCLTSAGSYVNLTTTPVFFYSQRTLDYPCADYPVYRLSIHYHKFLTTNDEGGRVPEQDP